MAVPRFGEWDSSASGARGAAPQGQQQQPQQQQRSDFTKYSHEFRRLRQRRTERPLRIPALPNIGASPGGSLTPTVAESPLEGGELAKEGRTTRATPREGTGGAQKQGGPFAPLYGAAGVAASSVQGRASSAQVGATAARAPTSSLRMCADEAGRVSAAAGQRGPAAARAAEAPLQTLEQDALRRLQNSELNREEILRLLEVVGGDDGAHAVYHHVRRFATVTSAAAPTARSEAASQASAGAQDAPAASSGRLGPRLGSAYGRRSASVREGAAYAEALVKAAAAAEAKAASPIDFPSIQAVRPDDSPSQGSESSAGSRGSRPIIQDQEAADSLSSPSEGSPGSGRSQGVRVLGGWSKGAADKDKDASAAVGDKTGADDVARGEGSMRSPMRVGSQNVKDKGANGTLKETRARMAQSFSLSQSRNSYARSTPSKAGAEEKAGRKECGRDKSPLHAAKRALEMGRAEILGQMATPETTESKFQDSKVEEKGWASAFGRHVPPYPGAVAAAMVKAWEGAGAVAGAGAGPGAGADEGGEKRLGTAPAGGSAARQLDRHLSVTPPRTAGTARGASLAASASRRGVSMRQAGSINPGYTSSAIPHSAPVHATKPEAAAGGVSNTRTHALPPGPAQQQSTASQQSKPPPTRRPQLNMGDAGRTRSLNAWGRVESANRVQPGSARAPRGYQQVADDGYARVEQGNGSGAPAKAGAPGAGFHRPATAGPAGHRATAGPITEPQKENRRPGTASATGAGPLFTGTRQGGSTRLQVNPGNIPRSPTSVHIPRTYELGRSGASGVHMTQAQMEQALPAPVGCAGVPGGGPEMHTWHEATGRQSSRAPEGSRKQQKRQLPSLQQATRLVSRAAQATASTTSTWGSQIYQSAGKKISHGFKWMVVGSSY